MKSGVLRRLGIAMLLVSCVIGISIGALFAVPYLLWYFLTLRVYDHYYMSFENTPSVEVMHYGKPDRLRWGKAVPLEYILRRDGYTIKIESGFVTLSRTSVAESFIQALAPDGWNLHVSLLKESSCTADGRSGNDMSRSDNRRHITLYYYCVVHGIRRSPGPLCQTGDECVVRLAVTNSRGDILGLETLPFEIRRNGFIVLNEFP